MSRKKRQVSLDPDTLNLNQRHFTRSKHGFEVIGTWYRTSATRWKFQPCIAIIPAVRWPTSRVVPVIIPLTDAWKWAMHGEIGDPEHCVMMAAAWFDEGILPGTPFNKKDHMRLYDAINESLPDLIAMPPRPKGEQVAIADVILNKETGEVIEREILRDV